MFRQHSAHLGFHGGIPNIDEHVFIFSEGADHGGEHGQDAVVEVKLMPSRRSRVSRVPAWGSHSAACDSRAGQACSGRSSFKAGEQGVPLLVRELYICSGQFADAF